MRRTARLLVLLPLALLATGAGAPGFVMIERPVEATLPNGLRVLVMEDHTAPVVSVQIWYHVGSKNEVPGLRGLAHLFEHLMFKGTHRVAPEEYSARIDAIGGEDNAFTSEDVTGYHAVLPSSHLELALWLEADRMRGLKLSDATIATEREVVKEEKRLRLENDQMGRTFEEFLALAWTAHPYAWTPAGTLEDLDRVTLADAQAFYDRWYQPSNAVLVIVGDVKKKKALALARTHFSPVKAGPKPEPSIPVEPAQTAIRERTLARSTELPMILGGWKIPPRSHADTPALEILSSILLGGEGSRLYRALVREQNLAIWIGGGAEGAEDPGLFLVYAAFGEDVTPESVKASVFAEIARLVESGTNAKELDKAKRVLTASYVFGLDTVEGKADALADAELLEGGWRRFLSGAKRYDDVTSLDVERVAKMYLVPERLTLITLVPAETGGEP